jgi:hypothetical protein
MFQAPSLLDVHLTHQTLKKPNTFRLWDTCSMSTFTCCLVSMYSPIHFNSNLLFPRGVQGNEKCFYLHTFQDWRTIELLLIQPKLPWQGLNKDTIIHIIFRLGHGFFSHKFKDPGIQVFSSNLSLHCLVIDVWHAVKGPKFGMNRESSALGDHCSIFS